jgi:hypothetical protein
MKISQILDKIDENQLFVPAFQREYVWKREDAKQLIRSLLREYPTGTMLTWDTNNPPELKGPHQYAPTQGSVKLILDGQQRITTLYLLIRGKLPPYYTEEEIQNNINGLYINLLSMELEYYKKTRMEKDPLWVDVTDLFQGKIDALSVIKALGEDFAADHLKIVENAGKIKNILDREFLEQTIPVKAEIREAIDIFYRVNSSGVNLTDAELALAQISGYWPDARDQIKKKMFELAASGWVFKLDFFIYCLLGVLHYQGSKMEKLHDPSNDEPLRSAWAVLSKDTLDYVCNLMREHAYVDHTKEINSAYALVPIIVFAYQKGKTKLTDAEIKRVVKWFYYSQLRTRYISQLQQKLDKDLAIVRHEKRPFDALLKLIEEERRLQITPEEFIGVGIQHPLWGLMKWYFKSRGAKCLTTGIGIRQNMGPKYSLEWDHIFPFSVLKKNGYGWEQRHKYNLAQEITNRAVLTQAANRSKSDSAAKEYLKKAQEAFPNSLRDQVIPEDETLWELENYEDFLSVRRDMLAKQLNAYLTGITKTAEVDTKMDAGELIAMGENHGVELKATLRWDQRLEKVNKELEAVILKTIAAFSNRDGGILFIGVADKKEVEGLEADYATLKDPSSDGFELHLLNVVEKAYGTKYAASGLKISFPVVDDKEICMVEVAAGRAPLYTEVADKNGAKSKKFFVRRGNSSAEVPLNEVAEYVKGHFG